MQTVKEISKKFIKSCAFIHDDHADGEIDHYSTNALLVGADVCVIDTLLGFGNSYLEYLANLIILPKFIIQPAYNNNSLLENLLADKAALSCLKGNMRGEKLDISTFYSHKKFNSLINIVSENSYAPKLYPPIEPFVLANDKIKAYPLLQQANAPLPYGKICFCAEDLVSFFKHCQQKYSYIIIKKNHRKNYAIFSYQDIQAICNTLDYPVIAEAGLKVKCSPVSNFLVISGVAHYLFTVEQLINSWKHTGNKAPIDNILSYKDQILEFSQQIISLFPGYEGIFGIDFIVTEDSSLLAVDINARFNSCTYPFFLLTNIGVQPESIRFIFKVVSVMVSNLSCVFEDDEFIPLSKKTLEGMFLFNPVYDFDRKIVYKFAYLCVGRDKYKVLRLEAILLNILRRVSIKSKINIE